MVMVERVMYRCVIHFFRGEYPNLKRILQQTLDPTFGEANKLRMKCKT